MSRITGAFIVIAGTTTKLPLLDRPVRWGRLGLIGFIGLVAAGLIVGLFFPDSQAAWKALGTCLAILVHAGLARIVASGLRRKYPNWYVIARLAWCAVSSLFVSIIIWDSSRNTFELLGVTTTVWIGLVVSDACARLHALGWYRFAARAGLAVTLAFIGLGCYVALRLPSFPGDDKAVISAFFLSLGFAAHAGVLLIGRSPDDRRWTIRVPAWLLLVCSFVAVALVWIQSDLGSDLSMRLKLATGFVAVACLVPAGFAVFTRRRAGIGESSSSGPNHTQRPRIDLVCPRCKMNVEATTGKSACPSCATEFRIEVRSAVCLSCGYSLTGVGAICPECGSNHGA
jgi:hypothetical protein